MHKISHWSTENPLLIHEVQLHEVKIYICDGGLWALYFVQKQLPTDIKVSIAVTFYASLKVPTGFCNYVYHQAFHANLEQNFW